MKKFSRALLCVLLPLMAISIGCDPLEKPKDILGCNGHGITDPGPGPQDTTVVPPYRQPDWFEMIPTQSAIMRTVAPDSGAFCLYEFSPEDSVKSNFVVDSIQVRFQIQDERNDHVSVAFGVKLEIEPRKNYFEVKNLGPFPAGPNSVLPFSTSEMGTPPRSTQRVLFVATPWYGVAKIELKVKAFVRFF